MSSPATLPLPPSSSSSSATTATDIITYIGIPLAVLGVLPILYTLARSILTLRSIRATLLRHGHVPAAGARGPEDGFTLRSSPMSSLIEVEVPRYTVAPGERGDRGYWRVRPGGEAGEAAWGRGRGGLVREESALSTMGLGEEGLVVRGFLRGGSWRRFGWRRLVVGRKLYRIQYEDELREPAAEMEFADLVHFLMDWGAVPVGEGWEKVRVGGLWTPGGTVLLERAGGKGDWVLRTTVPDESDGVLSLVVRWVDWGAGEGGVGASDADRSPESLPPGWARLRQPRLKDIEKDMGELEKEVHDEKEEDEVSNPVTLVGLISQAKSRSTISPASDSLRFSIADNTLITHMSTEQHCIETGSPLALWPTLPLQAPPTPSQLWFTSVAAALSHQQSSFNSGLWAYSIPSFILDIARKPLIPTGALVTLGIQPTQTSTWSPRDSIDSANAADPHNNPALRHQRRFLERQRRMAEERSMPSAQAEVARRNREHEERMNLHDDMLKDTRLRQEREERRVRDALDSQRLGNKEVARLAVDWLREVGFLEGTEEGDNHARVEAVAEAVLYLIVLEQQQRIGPNPEDNGFGARVLKLLEDWGMWAAQSSLKRADLTGLKERKLEFGCAAALVTVVEDAVGEQSVRSGEAMKECIRLWKRVRVG